MDKTAIGIIITMLICGVLGMVAERILTSIGKVDAATYVNFFVICSLILGSLGVFAKVIAAMASF